MREVFNLFSTPVFKTYLDYPVDKIEMLCQQERLKDSKGVVKSNLGGWQTGNITCPDTPFSFLFEIETICQEIAKNELLIDKQIYLDYAWININQKHHLNQTHSHGNNVLSGVLPSRIPVPTSTASPRSRHRGTLCLPVIDLAPRGEDGMVASVEEAESSASCTSSDRPFAVLPIVSPPRIPRMGLVRGKMFFKNIVLH